MEETERKQERRGRERKRERERGDSRAYDNKKSCAKNSSERSECTCKSAHTSADLAHRASDANQHHA